MIKEKKTKTMTFRLTEEEFRFLEKASYNMGSTPSRLVRQLIQVMINAQKAADRSKEGINNVVTDSLEQLRTQ